MIPEDWRTPIIADERKAFDFLEDRGASVEFQDGGNVTVVAYLLPDACFEVEFDWREEATFVLVCRRSADGRPPGYYAFDQRTMRVHVGEALGRAGLSDAGLRERLKSATRESGPDAMKDQLILFASVLHERLHELLRRYDRVFARP